MSDFSKYKILVVDDDDDLREILFDMITQEGFSCLTAHCGTKALEVAKSEKIDLVLTDMRMSDGDGMYLLKSLRLIHPTEPVVFFITGYTDVVESDFIANGAAKVYTKPFNTETLLSHIKKYLVGNRK